MHGSDLSDTVYAFDSARDPAYETLSIRESITYTLCVGLACAALFAGSLYKNRPAHTRPQTVQMELLPLTTEPPTDLYIEESLLSKNLDEPPQ